MARLRPVIEPGALETQSAFTGAGSAIGRRSLGCPRVARGAETEVGLLGPQIDPLSLSTRSLRSRWPRVHSLKAQKLEEPRFLRGHSRSLVRVEEVCLSHRLEGIDCSTSRIMTGDLAKIVTKLRREDGGNIIIEGGPRIGYEFIRRN